MPTIQVYFSDEVYNQILKLSKQGGITTYKYIQLAAAESASLGVIYNKAGVIVTETATPEKQE